MKRIPLERIYRRYVSGSYHWDASRIEVYNLLINKDFNLSSYFSNLFSLGFIELRYTRSNRYPHYRVFRTDLRFSFLINFGTCDYSDSYIQSVISSINNVLGHEK